MRNLVAILAASAAFAVLTPVAKTDAAFAKDKAKSAADTPTADGTQKNHGGAATGEQGSSSPGSQAQMQAWDATYQSDIAQEKQLKSGGKPQ